MRFSVHALTRLRQRFRLGYNELTTLISEKKYIKFHSVRNHDHLIVYSAPDNEYLVMIVSYDTQVIKTVLPVPFYLQQVDAKLKNSHLKAAKMLQVPYVEVRATVLDLSNDRFTTRILKRLFRHEVEQLSSGQILELPAVSRKIWRFVERAKEKNLSVEALHVERDGEVATFRSKSAVTFAAP